MKQAAAYREKSNTELTTELTDLYREQCNLRLQRKLESTTRPDQFRKVRRNIARIHTLLNERKRGANE